MTENVFKKCKFPNDLVFAAKKLESELAKRIENNQALYQEAVDASSGMDALIDNGFSILEEFFTKSGSSLKSTDDVASVYGLLPNNSTKDQDEQFLTNAGMFLFDSVGYIPGQNFDIKNLRRMYFAYGANLAKTKETMASAEIEFDTKSAFNRKINIVRKDKPAVFINDRLVLTVVPPKQKGISYKLKEIKKILNLDYLTDSNIVVADDQSTIVITKSYICEDKSQAQIVNVMKIPVYDLITNVFHFGQIDSSTTAIDRYKNLGYAGSSLGAILEGQDLANYNANIVTNMIAAEKQTAYDLITKIDYILLKYKDLSAKNNAAHKKFLVESMDKFEKAHRKSISTSLFQVSTFTNKKIYSLLAAKHKESKIEYLLRHRTDINDFYFNPTDAELLQLLRKVISSAPVGSTYISNRAVNYIENNPLPMSDLLFLYACIYDAKRVLMSGKNENELPNIYNLKKMREYLTNFVNHPFPVVSEKEQKSKYGDIFDGMPSAATPSSIITSNMDPLPTFGYDEKKEAVYDAFKELISIIPKEIAGPLADIINAVVGLFDQAMRMINQLMQQAQTTLFAMKKKLDAFISQYLSLTGGGVFQNSLLKCAINWDIGVSTDLLEMLATFLLNFIGQVSAFLAKLKAWIADILEKILCLPIDLINNFLGQIEMMLPNVCKLPRVSLGNQLTEALNNLRNVSEFYNVCMGALGSDIAKLRMEVWSAPDKLASFNSGSSCQSEAGAGFMTASVLNLGVGVGA